SRLLGFGPLDQLFDTLAALLADLLVAFGPVAFGGGLSPLLADLPVEVGAVLILRGAAALLADFFVELLAVPLADDRPALLTGFPDGHLPLFSCHRGSLLSVRNREIVRLDARIAVLIRGRSTTRLHGQERRSPRRLYC